MKKLEINYGPYYGIGRTTIKGNITLIVDNFFPVSVANGAYKVFRLINWFCEDDVKEELKNILETKAAKYKNEAAEHLSKGFYNKYKKSLALYKRALKNLELLQRGMW